MTKDYRQIEGRNPVLEALKANSSVYKIFLEEGTVKNAKILDILKLARANKIEVVKRGRKKLQGLSRTNSHQGVIALAEFLPAISLKEILKNCYRREKDPFIVILPEVLHDYNLGAVARTAEAAGADCLIVSKRITIDAAVSRASMGAIEYLPIVQESLYSALEILKKDGIKLIAAEPQAKTVYFKTKLTGPVAILVGSEDRGITNTLLNKIDLPVRIPSKGKVDSLNLSVAAALLIFEVVRQRSFH